jgi:ribonuclease H2 subunit A
MMGIDEAGRGPVLGPMVYGSCVAPISKFAELKAIGFDDSKELKDFQRAPLFAKIKRCPFIAWIADPISPAEISRTMCAVPKGNLNVISHDAAIGMVRLALAQGLNVQQLFVDTVGPPETYRALLRQHFPQIGEITVASKADSLFPIVSAASIVAKETRDAMLEHWEFPEEANGAVQIGRELGAGYPGIELTKKWLRDHIDDVFGLPDVVRFSWSTTERLVEERCVPVRWGDEEDADEEAKGKAGRGRARGGKDAGASGKQASMSAFFGSTAGISASAGAGARKKERAAAMSAWPAMSLTSELPLSGPR